MLAVIKKGITHGNYAGHPTHVKSLCIEIEVNSSTTTSGNQFYLSQDYNAFQLNNKIVTCIIVNTYSNNEDPNIIGNTYKPIKFPANIPLVTTQALRAYGFTLTLVGKQNNYLVYNYPLINLITTKQSLTVGTVPRTYKFYNLEIDVNKCYVAPFDPSLTQFGRQIVSFEFFYIDKK
jgi:hypothetical protein